MICSSAMTKGGQTRRGAMGCSREASVTTRKGYRSLVKEANRNPLPIKDIYLYPLHCRFRNNLIASRSLSSLYHPTSSLNM